MGHWLSAFLIWLGSWLSGYFIVATNAWMQYPTGHRVDSHGQIELASFWSLLVNKWVLWQYAHTMLGAVQTGCFVMAAVGAFYLLTKRHEFYGRTFVKGGVLIGAVAAILQLFPTGDAQGKLIADLCLARIKSAFEMNNIQSGHVTCYMEDISLLRSFGEGQHRSRGQ
jgi:cytochrome bd ubiquinol oxidase subunit I